KQRSFGVRRSFGVFFVVGVGNFFKKPRHLSLGFDWHGCTPWSCRSIPRDILWSRRRNVGRVVTAVPGWIVAPAGGGVKHRRHERSHKVAPYPPIYTWARVI